MHPRDTISTLIDAHAVLAQVLRGSRHVLGLEADQVHTLSVLGEEAPGRLVGVGGHQELDVAGTERQDGALEAKLLGVQSVVLFQAKQALITRDGRVEVANDHGQLNHVAQHWGGHIHWTVHGLYPNRDTPTTPPGSARRTESNPRL